jgi:hypothetical protein
VWSLGPHIYVTEFSGHLQDAHVDLLIGYSKHLIAGRRLLIDVFHEWTGMTGYDSSCRQRITRWALDNKGAFGEVHVAVTSKLVAMGVQVANLVLGNITAYTSKNALQAALRQRLIREGRSSIAPRPDEE